MTLQELLDTITARGALTDSRKGPMRTAVKQYAMILGIPAAQCLPETYHLPPQAHRRLIDSQAPPHLGPRALANLKNNIGWLIRKGLELELIEPFERPLASWRDAPRLGAHWMPHRRDSQTKPKGEDAYHLRPLPPRLAEEVAQYATWSTDLYAPGRPAHIKKRPITMQAHYVAIGAIAGYLVSIQQRDPQSLTLQALTQPDVVEAFVAWWVTRRGKVTRTIKQWLASLKVLAQYWLKDDASAQAICRIRQSLGAPEPVYDHRERTLSRQELDHIGQAIYPLNPRRLQEIKHSRYMQSNDFRDFGCSGRRYAWWAQMSLIIRLLTWIPMRQRQIREMQLKHNLYRHNGTWTITFQGTELKVARRDGRENEVTYDVPRHLQPLLEEWLEQWRPRLIQTPDCPLVFINTSGKPWNSARLCHAIESLTFKFGGVAVNPHMFRHIWATEYLKATRDAAGAAKWLGDTVATVMKHYAHLLDADAAKGPTQWMQAQLNPGSW
jgi:integrase